MFSIVHFVELERKLFLLGGNSVFDLSCACGINPSRKRGDNQVWIYPAALPNGQSVQMLKLLLDNRCQNDCLYCAQRAGRNTPRTYFTPEELAKVFDQLVRAKLVQALFLSSGLGVDPIRTMDRLLACVEIIRKRYQFRGFVHLKILPGVERAQVQRATQLAQRISINLEAPSEKHLLRLSRKKNFGAGILRRLEWISKLVQEPQSLAKGHTTQFVVGAAGESDLDILSAAQRMYQDYRLSRAYYSKFQPIPDTPLFQQEPVPFMREHRLYQSDFLLRKYGFRFDEIPFQKDGNLSLFEDPKTIWAKEHPEDFPIEVNQADRERLLRVPGLGPLSVERILAARKQGIILHPDDLKKLGVHTRQAAPFLLLHGKSVLSQLTLW